MLIEQIRQVVAANPSYAALAPAIEKQILHHDIISVLVDTGALSSLTFIGGTSLRLCYNSVRLSEDLDFNGGHDFLPSHLDGIEAAIKQFIETKYQTTVEVQKPLHRDEGNTSSWKISVIKSSARPDLPHQKIHIDVCAIPSFDVQQRPLINHYGMVVPTEGILVPVQSLEEALVDKLIALTYRAQRIKPRDLWDLVWLKQRSVELSPQLLRLKLEARNKEQQNFLDTLSDQIARVAQEEQIKKDFYSEMTRFLPTDIRARSIEKPEYWQYLQTEVRDIAKAAINSAAL